MLLKRPYLLFLVTAVLLTGFGFWMSGENTIDINIHDTYYVIAYRHLFWLVAEILAMLFVIYLIFEKGGIAMNSVLAKVHVLGTLLLLLVFFVLNFKCQSILSSDSYYTITNQPHDYYLDVIYVLIFIIVFQFLFIINIFTSIIKRFRNS
jgi:heme/copper-type cytochrome/quinol oxidase subunit 1